MAICRNAFCIVASALCTFMIVGYTSWTSEKLPIVSHDAPTAIAVL